jgi:hypothetical protein
MKKVIFSIGLAACLMFISTTPTFAFNFAVSSAIDQDSSVKKEITFAESPLSVQRAFTAEKVSADNILAIYEITDGKNITYKVKFTRDGKTWVTKYAPDGNLIERKEKTEK